MPHPCVTAETYPYKPAIIMADSGETVSYRQLDERSNQGAQLLRALGLKKGDHLALMMENTRQFLEICWAAQRAGVTYTPISTHLLYNEAEYVVQNCSARVFIVSYRLHELARQMREQLTLDGWFMVNGVIDGYESWEEVCDRQPVTPIADQANGQAMLYSSGTTGMPKGVYVPPDSDDVLADLPVAQVFGEAFGFGEETVYLSPAPLYHAAPLVFNLITLYRGGTCVIMERFDAERALALIEEHRVTHSQWVPIMFVRMLKLPPETRQRYDLSSHQVAVHAAAPCPVTVKEAMINWWGEILVEYYSASERVGITIIDSGSWLSHRGSVGPAVMGTIHIVDDDGQELPVGETGTVYFSGDQVTFSYHDEPQKTADAYNSQGWATVGDIGYVDEDGFLYLTDRKHFTIVSGGVNIYPQEIENLLVDHDKVADVAVFGVPCEEFGESVKAVVQPVNWADATDEVAIELLEWLRERLSHIKLPRVIEFDEQLPRLDNGKLYKRRLVDKHRAGTSSDAS